MPEDRAHELPFSAPDLAWFGESQGMECRAVRGIDRFLDLGGWARHLQEEWILVGPQPDCPFIHLHGEAGARAPEFRPQRAHNLSDDPRRLSSGPCCSGPLRVGQQDDLLAGDIGQSVPDSVEIRKPLGGQAQGLGQVRCQLLAGQPCGVDQSGTLDGFAG
ncbi:hypothetical protein [Streptomyces sp. NBC_01465]|uniref:hypothetical protein n=1 Tax=Streptomyces sp. NBC_01465 TaxID=2903878 RepID=UPI002E363C74|nr:hypothetical protein [Streptomyces sp. NBC_01465]